MITVVGRGQEMLVIDEDMDIFWHIENEKLVLTNVVSGAIVAEFEPGEWSSAHKSLNSVPEGQERPETQEVEN